MGGSWFRQNSCNRSCRPNQNGDPLAKVSGDQSENKLLIWCAEKSGERERWQANPGQTSFSHIIRKSFPL
jgi:hypothetical protein